MLNYKPRNQEINMLYLAFSNLTKTIKVARNSLYEGDDNQALLGYHEVAQIFEKLENQEKLGSCMNNLGCIYLKKDQFEISKQFLDKAIKIQGSFIDQENKKGNKDNMKERASNSFVKACRLYNKGLSCQKYILKIITEYLPNHSLATFVKEIPDLNSKDSQEKGISTKGRIFLQRAVLCQFNRVASVVFMKKQFENLSSNLQDKL